MDTTCAVVTGLSLYGYNCAMGRCVSLIPVEKPYSIAHVCRPETPRGVGYCKPNNFWQSSNLAVQNGFISRGSSGLPQLFRVAVNSGGVRVQVLEFLHHSLKFPIWLVIGTYHEGGRQLSLCRHRDSPTSAKRAIGPGCWPTEVGGPTFRGTVVGTAQRPRPRFYARERGCATPRSLPNGLMGCSRAGPSAAHCSLYV